MSRALVKRIDMALHVQELCAKNNITVKYQSLNEKVPRYYANQRLGQFVLDLQKILVIMFQLCMRSVTLLALIKHQIMILLREKLVLGNLQ